MSDRPDAMTLELLGRLLREVQAEQRAARRQRTEEVDVLRALVERVGRTDRHIAELRDDLELMIRSELMGRLGHLETRLDDILEPLTARVDALEGGLAPR